MHRHTSGADAVEPCIENAWYARWARPQTCDHWAQIRSTHYHSQFQTAPAPLKFKAPAFSVFRFLRCRNCMKLPRGLSQNWCNSNSWPSTELSPSPCRSLQGWTLSRAWASISSDRPTQKAIVSNCQRINAVKTCQDIQIVEHQEDNGDLDGMSK